MPWSSRTFSSRNGAAGWAQRERVREKPQPTLGSSGLDCAQRFQLFVLLLQSGTSFLSCLHAEREAEAGGSWRANVPLCKTCLGLYVPTVAPSPLSPFTRGLQRGRFSATGSSYRPPELEAHILSSSILKSSQLSRNNSQFFTGLLNVNIYMNQNAGWHHNKLSISGSYSQQLNSFLFIQHLLQSKWSLGALQKPRAWAL